MPGLLRFLLFVVMAAAAGLSAAELRFDFGESSEEETPAGFRSTLAGDGRPGKWRVIWDELPSALATISPGAPSSSKRRVLAQLAADPTDERFPMLIYEEETFGDFTLTTRFKNAGGFVEQMAGIAFRFQDENNYYYIRASSLGNTFRFYKVVNGIRSQPIGVDVSIPKDVWHELTIECQGSRIRSLLNGKELLPWMTDFSFSSGKIGFWTKSDSIPYFAETVIQYKRLVPFLQSVLTGVIERNPRLVDLKVFAMESNEEKLKIIASKNGEERGKPGGKIEKDVIERGVVYFGKTKKTATVTLPLHDRNGKPVAAVQVVLQTFFGQTEKNAVARATPIVKELELRTRAMRSLVE